MLVASTIFVAAPDPPPAGSTVSVKPLAMMCWVRALRFWRNTLMVSPQTSRPRTIAASAWPPGWPQVVVSVGCLMEAHPHTSAAMSATTRMAIIYVGHTPAVNRVADRSRLVGLVVVGSRRWRRRRRRPRHARRPRQLDQHAQPGRA